MSGVRRESSASPMFSGAFTEWLPALGVSWQVVHVPLNDAGIVTPFENVWLLSPATPLIVIGNVLKRRSPRTIALRASSRASGWGGSDKVAHTSNNLKALGLNAIPAG